MTLTYRGDTTGVGRMPRPAETQREIQLPLQLAQPDGPPHDELLARVMELSPEERAPVLGYPRVAARLSVSTQAGHAESPPSVWSRRSKPAPEASPDRLGTRPGAIWMACVLMLFPMSAQAGGGCDAGECSDRQPAVARPSVPLVTSRTL